MPDLGMKIKDPDTTAAASEGSELASSRWVKFCLILEARDVSNGLPRSFDVITTFDVVHDAVDSLGLLRSIREGLRSGGIYVCLETNCADTVEGNKGPLGSLFHGMSVLYCLTTSLSNGGAGLGTLGLHEHRLREYAIVAGFRDVRRVFQDPFNNLYELR